MRVRKTILDKAIETIDDKIAALQLARTHLLEEQATVTAAAKPKKVPTSES